MAAVWFFKTLFYTGAPAQLSKLELKPISSPWRDYAAQQIYARAQTGLPYDLTRIPKNQWRPLPDLVIYGPMGSLLSGMDGRKNLAQIILETEADRGITLTEAEIKKYIDSINYLTDWGYLKAVKRTALTQEMLTAALAELGVVPGDVLLVHASVSNFGYVKDGAETLIRAIMAATGEEGGALFPTFTRPYIYLGENLNKSWSYRPFDAGDLSQIWTGTVPKTVLEKFPDAVRSRHITHSWAGLGIKAQKCVEAHGPTDPPTSLKSPLGKALEMNGKVLYLGTGLEPSIFLHLIETVIHAAYLQSAVCRVKNPDGTLRTVLIEDHLPGHRDFYRKDAEHSKFFQCAVPEGLKIAEKSFGMGKLQLIELREFYEIGMKLLQKDPRILLCDDPDCWFCRKF